MYTYMMLVYTFASRKSIRAYIFDATCEPDDMHSPDVGEQMEIACGFAWIVDWLTWAKTAKINATKRNLGTPELDRSYFMRLTLLKRIILKIQYYIKSERDALFM